MGIEGREVYSNGEATGFRLFYKKDQLGSTRMVVTGQDAGDIVEATALHSYGNLVSLLTSPEREVREKFTGKEYDREDTKNGNVSGCFILVPGTTMGMWDGGLVLILKSNIGALILTEVIIQ
jgi:hypothetical protein